MRTKITIFFLAALLTILALHSAPDVKAQNGDFDCVWNTLGMGSCQLGSNRCIPPATPDTSICQAYNTARDQAGCNSAKNLPCLAATPTPRPTSTSVPPVYSCSPPDECLTTCPQDWTGTADTCVPGLRCCRPPYGEGANVNIYCKGNDPTDLTSDPTGRIATAIGCIPFLSITGMLRFLYPWAIGMAGGIALLLIGYAGFQIITAAGNPQKLQSGKELLWAAIGGILLIAFSSFILRVIGVDVLQIFQ
jgi:hypothetical protein